MAGTQLRRYRENKNWSQQALADRLGAAEITVQRWERGGNMPGPYFRAKLCQLFDVSETELFGSEAVSSLQETTPTAAPAVVDPVTPLIPLHHFIGRIDELSKIKARLLTGSNVLLTALEGIPGVGKTTLAVALANDSDIRNHFKDGILWAGLGPKPNILGILSRWGTLFNVSVPHMETEAASASTWGPVLRHAIGLRRVLIVIDDIWAADHAVPLQVGGPNCGYLVTSRYPSEANFLAPGGTVHLNEFTPTESLELLRRLAPFAVEREPEKVTELITAIGGLPLALTLFGNYLRKQSYSGQERRIRAALVGLQDRETRLHLSELRAPTEMHPSLEVPHVSLEEIIAASTRQLSDACNEALYALSVFPPKPYSFTEQAALSVAACSPDEFDMLLDAGIVSFMSSGSEGTENRYTLHQTIHDYAFSRLEHSPNRQDVYTRLICYVHALVDQEFDHGIFERENALLLAALQAALTLQSKSLLFLLRQTIPYFFQNGNYVLLEPYLRAAVQLAQDPEDELLFILSLARSLQAQARFESEKELLFMGLKKAQEHGYPIQVEFLSSIGCLLQKMGRNAESEPFLLQGLELARESGDERSLFFLYRYLGSCYDQMARYVESGEQYTRCFDLAMHLQDKELMCKAHVSLGINCGNRGFEEEAEAHWLQGLALAKEMGLVETQCVLLVNLAEVHNQRESAESLKLANLYLQECLALAEPLRLKEWIAIAALISGAVYRKQKDYEQARQSLHKSLQLGHELAPSGYHRIIAQSLMELGEIALEKGEHAHAEQLFLSVQEATPPNDRESEALLYYGLARLALVSGDWNEARRYGELCLGVFERIGHGWVKKIAAWLKSLEKN